MNLFAKKLQGRFWQERSGQSMLFTALTIFLLIIMIGLIVGVGEVSSDQMRLQNATDAAAYSGAAVQADILAQIAWLNEGAAATYYKALASSVYNINANTKASLNYVWYDPAEAGLPSLPGAAVTPSAFTAPSTTNSWSTNGKTWYVRMVTIERLLAVLAPFAIRNQVYQTAHANFFYGDSGSDEDKPLRLAIYPNPGNASNPAWSFYPEGGAYHNAVLEHNPTDLSEDTLGWRVTSESDPGYEMEALHTVIDEAVDNGTYNQWHILFDEPVTDSNKDTAHVELLIDETVYSPRLYPKTEAAFTVTEASASGAISSRSVSPAYYKKSMYLASEVKIKVNNEINFTLRSYSMTLGGEIVMVYSGSEEKNDDGTTNKYLSEDTSDGSYLNGKKYSVDADGNVIIGGVKISKTVKINGRRVPVSAPSGTGSALQSISFEWPLSITIAGKLGITASGSGLDMAYLFNYAIGWIHANDQRAWVHGLSTLSPSDRWESPSGLQGRLYQRLTEYPFEEKIFGDPWDRFRYEYSNVGSYLQDMSLRKLGFRGLMVNSGDAPLPAELKDTGYVPFSAVPRQYNGEDNDFRTDDGLWKGYESSVWDQLAENNLLWACPPRTPNTAKQAALTGGFGGYLDLSTGQLCNVDADGNYVRPYVYALTGGKSPYADRIRGQFVSDGWKLKYRYYVVWGDILWWIDGNPLWSYYRSFAGDAEDAALSDIEINESNKDSCGFFVIGKYNLENYEDRVALSDLTDQLNAIDVEEFYPDSGLSLWLPYFIYEDNGLFYLAIYDPYGSLAMFNQQPKYPFESPDLYDMEARELSPTWTQIRNIVAKEPARVRRYAYHALGIDTVPTKADFLAYGMGCDISSVNRPLEATSQVFRTPVVVSAWKPEKISWLAPLFGKTSYDDASSDMRRVGLGNPLYITSETSSTKWSSGHFAISAARVFFRPPQSGNYVTNFAYCGDDCEDLAATAGVQSSAAMTYPNYVDAITEQHLSGYRQRWLGSIFNLFQPEWTAALVPINASLQLEDLLPASEIIDENDSPGAFMLRQFNTAADNYYNSHYSANDGWIKNAWEFDSGWSQEDQRANRAWHYLTAPPQQGGANGNAVQWDSTNMPDVVRH